MRAEPRALLQQRAERERRDFIGPAYTLLDGDWHYVYRMSWDGGVTYSICDTDGLSEPGLRRALADGHMPYLEGLVDSGSHTLGRWWAQGSTRRAFHVAEKSRRTRSPATLTDIE